MKRSALVLTTVLIAMVAAVGCGESLTAPTSQQAPFTGQFGGTWSGSMLLTGVSGGECVGADLSARAASGSAFDQGTINVAQTANNVSAVVRSATTGLSCRYDGSAAFTSFALSAVSCADSEVFFQCSNGNSRILNLVGSTMTATRSGTTATGVVTSTYNVSLVDAQNQRKPVAGLTVQHQFTALRR